MQRRKFKKTHPKAAATNHLKEPGDSLQAIKKYLSATLKVDAEKLEPFIRKFLKSVSTSRALVQRKGKGVSGSFKLKAAGEVTPKKMISAARLTAKKSMKPVLSNKAPVKPKAPKPKNAAAKKLKKIAAFQSAVEREESEGEKEPRVNRRGGTRCPHCHVWIKSWWNLSQHQRSQRCGARQPIIMRCPTLGCRATFTRRANLRRHCQKQGHRFPS